MTGKEAVEKLHILRACREAIVWVGGQETYEQAWATCERGDWMLWLLGKFAGPAWGEKRKPLVLAACECARLALPYTKDPRVLKCIETAEAWTRGEATNEEIYAAADAAAAAADAAAAAAYAAAYAAADAASAAAARFATLKQCADIVRKHYPTAPDLEGVTE
jgi:hypothetical protein